MSAVTARATTSTSHSEVPVRTGSFGPRLLSRTLLSLLIALPDRSLAQPPGARSAGQLRSLQDEASSGLLAPSQTKPRGAAHEERCRASLASSRSRMPRARAPRSRLVGIGSAVALLPQTVRNQEKAIDEFDDWLFPLGRQRLSSSS